MTTLIANVPGLNIRSPAESRQSLSIGKCKQTENSKRWTESRNSKELDFSSDGATNGHQKLRNKHKSPTAQLTRSTANLVFKQSQIQLHSPRRKTRVESAMEQLQKNRKTNYQSLEFDSEPTYYRLQVLPSIFILTRKKKLERKL